MAEGMILRRGGAGGVAVRVMIGAVQPSGSAGMLWVNTSLDSEKWTAAVAEPGSPASGDIWVQTNATSGNIINLIKRNNVANINVARVMQYSGTAWEAKEAYYHNGSAWAQVSTAFDPSTDISYTGTYSLLDDGDGHWRIKFLTSGTLRFLVDPGADLDAFLAGGGGGGGSAAAGGGGGGYTATQTSIPITVDQDYPIVIGAGGASGTSNNAGGAGGTTSGLGASASGGAGGAGWNTAGSHAGWGGAGGSGGGGGYDNTGAMGGAGGTDGGNGTTAQGAGGAGQGTTTREFAEAAGALYAGGGGGANQGAGGPSGGGAGGANLQPGAAGTANTGGGGGGGGTGGATVGGAGGSGIFVIRDHRAA